MKKKIYISIITVILSLALMLSLVGCNKNQEDAKSKTIVLGMVDWAGMYPWFGVRDTGIFEKNNVNVEVKYFQKYSEMIFAFASGNIDIACLSYGDTIPAMESGLKYKFVSVTDVSFGADGLVADPKYKSVAELKGKKVATEFGTSDHYYLAKILEQNGMSMNDIDYVNLSLSEANAALTSGQVDAVVTLEPFMGELVKSGFNVLHDSSQMYGIVPASILVKNDVLEERREDIKKVLNSWYDGVDKINARDKDFISATANGAGITVEDFESYLDIVKFLTPQEGCEAFVDSDQYISIEYNTYQWADFFLECDLIKNKPANIDEYLDDTLIKEIIKERK